jgi:hypothetical protein
MLTVSSELKEGKRPRNLTLEKDKTIGFGEEENEVPEGVESNDPEKLIVG